MPTGMGVALSGVAGGVMSAVYTEPRLGGLSGKERVSRRDSLVASTS